MIGQTLGHYSIVERIGAGGMGEVYRAHDAILDRDVALKVLPAGVLADESARKQFRKEALSLAKLNHPNIETVFEFNTHDGLDFLAMELIHGTSLSQRLREGPLAQKQILVLGAQLAEGLAAAHEQHIVHRDLKPGNLMITLDGRLKILDFGLARLAHPGQNVDVTLSAATTTGFISGTVPYMSPEQLRGHPVDARSDIYAAGVVLYEMASGQRPYAKSQGAELIGAILHQAPDPPSTRNPNVSPALESVIFKAIEKEPAQRYQSARELRVALDGVASGALPKPAAHRFSLYAAVGAAAALLLLAGLGLGLNLGGLGDRFLHRGSAASGILASSPIKARRSIAVLGFKNVSQRQEEAWLSTALAEMLTTELAAGEQLRAIPGENVARIKTSLSLPETDSYGRDTLERIRKNLNADEIVLGSFVPLGGGQIRVDLRLQDTRAGDILAVASVKGDEAQVDDLVARAAAVLRQKLGVGSVSEADATSVRAALSPDLEAVRLYAEGLTKLREFDAVAARNLLQKAVDADPKYALAHAALSRAWSALGFDGQAKDDAQKAFELSTNLPRDQRLLIEARYREVTADWKKATEIYKSLLAFFPDNPDYGLLLANSQNRGGSPKDALETVESMRKSLASSDVDPRIDIADGEAARTLGDFKREQAAAGTALAKGETLGAQLLIARAVDLQAFALWKLGQPGPATTAYERAKQIYATAGDRNGVATELNRMAGVRWEQGDLDGAEKLFEESYTISRESGDQGGIAAALNNHALVLMDRGDLARAGQMYREASEIAHNTGNKWGEFIALSNLGDTLSAQGDLHGARKVLEQAIAGFHQIGDKNNAALQSNELANVRYLQGDIADAKTIQQEALSMGKETGDKRIWAWALSNLAMILEAQGDLAGARKNYDEALHLQSETGEQGLIGRTQLALADLSLKEGNFTQIDVTKLDEILQGFEKSRSIDDEISAHNVLSRILAGQGKLPEALKHVEAGEALAARNQNLEVRLDLGIAAGEVRSALGSISQAKSNLESALAQARKAGFVGYQLEARLAMGELELKSDRATGRAHLASLQKDAASKGFQLIARDAAAARQ